MNTGECRVSEKPMNVNVPTNGSQLLPWRLVRPMTGDLGYSTVWRMMRDGLFPKPISVSPGRVAWRESDILDWQDARGASPASA